MAETTRFDVTRVRLRHYRSIAQCDVALGDMTLLVGPNGSGKSNFLDSLRLVSQALTENLDNALRERGGIAEVRRRSTGHPTHVAMAIMFTSGEWQGEYSFQLAAVSGGDYRVSHEDCRVGHAVVGGAQHHYSVRDGAVISSSETTMPPVSSDRLFLVAASGLPGFRPAYDGLSAINTFSLNPDAMRLPQRPDAGDMLRRDGANVASVMERIRRQDPASRDMILAHLRTIVAGVDGVDRLSIGNYETLQFLQRIKGASAPWRFPATSMSDGTLRALGVLVALFAPVGGTYGPVGIEEPEIALHPAAAGALLDALVAASAQRQVVTTSHSPDLLDSPALTPENVIAVRAEGGATVLAPLDAASASVVRDHLFTPGELLRVDQLIPEPQPYQQPMIF